MATARGAHNPKNIIKRPLHGGGLVDLGESGAGGGDV